MAPRAVCVTASPASVRARRFTLRSRAPRPATIESTTSKAAVATATKGCSTRSRTSRCERCTEVGPQGLGQGLRREKGVPERGHGPTGARQEDEEGREGEERGFPRPPPQAHGRPSAREVGGEGQRTEQEERVHEVGGHEEAAGQGAVLGHELEEDEHGPDRGLAQHEGHRPGGGAPCRVPPRPDTEDPDEKRHDQEQGHPAREPVRELDERGRGLRARNDLAVAERPVAAAARAGAGGAHDRAPEDDEDVVAEDHPGETGQTIHRRIIASARAVRRRSRDGTPSTRRRPAGTNPRVPSSRCPWT